MPAGALAGGSGRAVSGCHQYVADGDHRCLTCPFVLVPARWVAPAGWSCI